MLSTLLYISLTMNTMMCILYKEKIIFSIKTNTFSKKPSTKIRSIKQIRPKMEQQNYLRTIFGHAYAHIHVNTHAKEGFK